MNADQKSSERQPNGPNRPLSNCIWALPQLRKTQFGLFGGFVTVLIV
jgi:hypothetical protein